MVIEKEGKQCTCGKKGCFETYASMKMLKEKIKKENNITREIHSKELMEILVDGSQKSNQIIDEYLNDLRVGIANLVDLFEPEIVSIGGSFTYYPELFLEKFINKMHEEHTTFNERTDLKIVLATQQNDAGIIGSIIQ